MEQNSLSRHVRFVPVTQRETPRVLVGASVDIRYTLKAGPAALAMIFAALLIRTLAFLFVLPEQT